MVVRTKDALEVRLGMNLQYRFVEANIGLMYGNFKDGYYEYFSSILRSGLQLVGSNFEFEELWTRRDEVNSALHEMCQQLTTVPVLQGGMEGMIECWAVQLLDIYIDQMIDDVIEARQVQKQMQSLEIEKRKYKLVTTGTQVMVSDYSKRISIVNAEAQAGAFKVKSQAHVDADYNSEAAHASMLATSSDLLGLTPGELVKYLEQISYVESTSSEMVMGAFTDTGVMDKIGAARMLMDKPLGAPTRSLIDSPSAEFAKLAATMAPRDLQADPLVIDPEARAGGVKESAFKQLAGLDLEELDATREL